MHFHSIYIIYIDNNIQFIDQCLAHLRSLIQQFRAQSAAAGKRLADTIITLEIKRIEAIHALERRLGELRALIPVNKARCLTYEHVLAKQIINLDLQLIAAKTKLFNIYFRSISTCTTSTCTKSTRKKSTLSAANTIKRYGRNLY